MSGALRPFLTAMAAAWALPIDGFRAPIADELVYNGPHDFVLQHGVEYSPAYCLPGAPRLCYANAMLYAARFGVTYVEGYAQHPKGVMPVPHAWCVDLEGRAVEVTWDTPKGEYLGVEFSVERADDCSWHGDATVIDDYKRGYPLLRQRWRGENHGLTWAYSPRLDAIRRLADTQSDEERAALLVVLEAELEELAS